MVHAYWSLFVPTQAVGASVVFFDLWNGSDRAITVSSVLGIKDGETAVAGVVAVELWLTRTSAVGTGGTANTEDGSSLTACTITKVQQYDLPDGITARLTPTGGATAAGVLSTRHIFPEETNAANYEPLEFCPTLLTVANGSGIRVVQGSTASVGSLAWQVLFY